MKKIFIITMLIMSMNVWSMPYTHYFGNITLPEIQYVDSVNFNGKQALGKYLKFSDDSINLIRVI